jgi:hypothetical protein
VAKACAKGEKHKHTGEWRQNRGQTAAKTHFISTVPRLLVNDIKYREGKVNVCHHIKGHIPLLVYPSFKPYQFKIWLP